MGGSRPARRAPSGDDVIYAKVDVKLRDHERAMRAGVAMGTWLWALLYVVEQETDGAIPSVALRLAWAGEKDARKHAAVLVRVGLWEPTDDGWRICRFADKNATRDEVAKRRREVLDRVTKHRRNALHVVSVTEGTATAVPGSGSGSGSGSALGSSPGRDPEPDRSSMPAWWAGAIAATEHAIGGTVADAHARWLSYDSSRERKGWQRGHRDAVGWLSDVVRRERRDEKTTGVRARPADVTKQPFDPEAPWIKDGDTGT